MKEFKIKEEEELKEIDKLNQSRLHMSNQFLKTVET
jgi:hypothetical protein